MTKTRDGSADEPRGLVLKVSVIPGADRERVGRLANGWIRVFLDVPPKRARGSEGLIRLLAQALEVPEDAIAVLSGAAHPRKLVRVTGVSRREVNGRIKRLLPGRYRGRASFRQRVQRATARKNRRASAIRGGGGG